MAESNGKIKAPISISDIQKCIGDNSVTVAGLCTSEQINKWSRRKPVDSTTLFYASNSDLERANFGLSVPVISGTFDACIAKIIAKDPSTIWKYVPPKGGKASPFRMTDFEHYYHNATPPFPAPVKSGEIGFNLADEKITINFDFPVDEVEDGVTSIDSYNIKLAELSVETIYNLMDFKLAIGVKNPKSTAPAIRFESKDTLADALEDNDLSITVSSQDLSCGFTYDCYPFLYLEQTDGFLIVPSDGMSFNLRCYYNESGALGGDDTRNIIIDLNYVNGIPTGTVKIYNRTTQDIRLGEAHIDFWYDLDGDIIDLATWDITTAFTVPKNSSVTIQVPGGGTWRYGDMPEYDSELTTWAKFYSKIVGKGTEVNSEDTEVWLG